MSNSSNPRYQRQRDEIELPANHNVPNPDLQLREQSQRYNDLEIVKRRRRWRRTTNEECCNWWFDCCLYIFLDIDTPPRQNTECKCTNLHPMWYPLFIVILLMVVIVSLHSDDYTPDAKSLDTLGIFHQRDQAAAASHVPKGSKGKIAAHGAGIPLTME